MDIILFGIQGSGKGTLGKAVAEKYDYAYFETGGELRRLAAEESELGKKVKAIIDAGHLVDNDTVFEIVDSFLDKNTDKPVIFDGFPRELNQAKKLEVIMKKHQKDFRCILVDIPEQTALNRITTRRICENCKTVYAADYKEENCSKCQGRLITRKDDNPESIRTRIEAYYRETLPVIEMFAREGKMIKMDGTSPIPEAQNSMFKIIESLR